MKKTSFSFDWIIHDTNPNYRRTELIDLYKSKGYDIVFIKVHLNQGIKSDDWVIRYEVGNPLLGGVKTYKSYANAERHFYELIGMIERAKR